LGGYKGWNWLLRGLTSPGCLLEGLEFGWRWLSWVSKELKKGFVEQKVELMGQPFFRRNSGCEKIRGKGGGCDTLAEEWRVEWTGWN
jgi:hypothetical protein